MSDYVRIQIDIPKDRINLIDDLVDSAKCSTRRELLNNALSMLEWALRERKNGRIIASLDEESKVYKELCMPILGC
jgi:metal-responsive CopG/Arc/MetJ family transcriptional regulator